MPVKRAKRAKRVISDSDLPDLDAAENWMRRVANGHKIPKSLDAATCEALMRHDYDFISSFAEAWWDSNPKKGFSEINYEIFAHQALDLRRYAIKNRNKEGLRWCLFNELHHDPFVLEILLAKQNLFEDLVWYEINWAVLFYGCAFVLRDLEAMLRNSSFISVYLQPDICAQYWFNAFILNPDIINNAFDPAETDVRQKMYLLTQFRSDAIQKAIHG